MQHYFLALFFHFKVSRHFQAINYEYITYRKTHFSKDFNIQDTFIYLFLMVNNLRLMMLLYGEKLLQVVLKLDLVLT